MGDDDVAALVVDSGSYMSKAGFAGDDVPRAVFPTIVGYPNLLGQTVGMNQDSHYCGNKAQSMRVKLNLEHPVERGTVTSWYDMEKVGKRNLCTFKPRIAISGLLSLLKG